MLELALAIARQVGFSEVDEGIFRDGGHKLMRIDSTPSILL